jgi:hypothetical protein
MIEYDFTKKLEITIHNEKPIVLTDLTLALLGVSQQYQRFIESETNQDYQVGSELFVKEVRKGSIVVELVSQVMPIVPLIWSGGSLSEWVNQSKAIIDWFLGKIETPPKDLSKQDLNQWNNILNPIAKDNSSQLNITASDGGIVIGQICLNSIEANAAQNAIVRELGVLAQPDDHIQKNRVMFWYQTKFDSESHTGDKAIIENISGRPVKVIFDNNAVKEAMLSGDARFHKPWHKLAYLVDVQVQTINGVPKVYTILKYHPEHTFDPDEP